MGRGDHILGKGARVDGRRVAAEVLHHGAGHGGVPDVGDEEVDEAGPEVPGGGGGGGGGGGLEQLEEAAQVEVTQVDGLRRTLHQDSPVPNNVEVADGGSEVRFPGPGLRPRRRRRRQAWWEERGEGAVEGQMVHRFGVGAHIQQVEHQSWGVHSDKTPHQHEMEAAAGRRRRDGYPTVEDMAAVDQVQGVVDESPFTAVGPEVRAGWVWVPDAIAVLEARAPQPVPAVQDLEVDFPYGGHVGKGGAEEGRGGGGGWGGGGGGRVAMGGVG